MNIAAIGLIFVCATLTGMIVYLGELALRSMDYEEERHLQKKAKKKAKKEQKRLRKLTIANPQTGSPSA